jgi:hypothetical protein
VRYAAQLDAQGNPIKGADGQFVKGELLGYAVMEKRTAGAANTRTRCAMANGNIAHSQRKRSQMRTKLTACFECQKPTANHDFVYSYDKLKSAGQ